MRAHVKSRRVRPVHRGRPTDWPTADRAGAQGWPGLRAFGAADACVPCALGAITAARRSAAVLHRHVTHRHAPNRRHPRLYHRRRRWTTSELLSGLRSIEWDLQDLEDTVSIVKGNRVKFQLDDADVQARTPPPARPQRRPPTDRAAQRRRARHCHRVTAHAVAPAAATAALPAALPAALAAALAAAFAAAALAFPPPAPRDRRHCRRPCPAYP